MSARREGDQQNGCNTQSPHAQPSLYGSHSPLLSQLLLQKSSKSQSLQMQSSLSPQPPPGSQSSHTHVSTLPSLQPPSIAPTSHTSCGGSNPAHCGWSSQSMHAQPSLYGSQS